MTSRRVHVGQPALIHADGEPTAREREALSTAHTIAHLQQPANEKDHQPMTSRRVNIGLTYATDHDHAELLTEILQRLEGIGCELTGANVHAFDLDEDDDSPTVYEVHDVDAFGNATLLARLTDLDRADARARQARGVVVELPVIADYRKNGATS